MHASADPFCVDYYLPLCQKTAWMYYKHTEEDYEDVVQILHLKCWRALQTFDAERSAMPVERYVFSCMKNMCKDLLKKKKHYDHYVEDMMVWTQTDMQNSSDGFHFRYLSSDHDQVFGEIDEGEPLIPSTLSTFEREVVCYLVSGYNQKEIADELDLDVALVRRAVKSVRVKMADWAPEAEPKQSPSTPGSTRRPADASRAPHDHCCPGM